MLKKIIIDELGSFFFGPTGKNWKTQMNSNDKKEFLKTAEHFADTIIQKLKDSGIDKKINAIVRQGMCNVIYLTVEENADYAYNKADIYAPERGKEILKIILED